MPTRTLPLNEADRRVVHRCFLTGFLHGECYAFAIALHEGLGWPIVGLMVGDVIYHAAVKDPEGRLFDARGFVPEMEFGMPFGVRPPFTLHEMSPHELDRDGEPEERRAHLIQLARQYAETAWPELPWKDASVQRIKAFCDALEQVCRRHGLWIRAPYPAARPVITTEDGKEGGYEIQPTVNNSEFTLNRYFKD